MAHSHKVPAPKIMLLCSLACLRSISTGRRSQRDQWAGRAQSATQRPRRTRARALSLRCQSSISGPPRDGCKCVSLSLLIPRASIERGDMAVLVAMRAPRRAERLESAQVQYAARTKSVALSPARSVSVCVVAQRERPPGETCIGHKRAATLTDNGGARRKVNKLQGIN